MDNAVLVFFLRASLGLGGGWLLSHVFFTPTGGKVDWFIALLLAALVVSAAYLSEAWRARKGQKK
jgi:hypothetical protein